MKIRKNLFSRTRVYAVTNRKEKQKNKVVTLVQKQYNFKYSDHLISGHPLTEHNMSDLDFNVK